MSFGFNLRSPAEVRSAYQGVSSMGLPNSLYERTRRTCAPPPGGGHSTWRGRLAARLAVELLEDRSLLSSVTIGPGDSIQAAVDAATPGTTIYLRSGTYLQSVVVNKPDIAIVGLGHRKRVRRVRPVPRPRRRRVDGRLHRHGPHRFGHLRRVFDRRHRPQLPGVGERGRHRGRERE